MGAVKSKLPIGNSERSEAVIHSPWELGALVRARRKHLDLTQLDVAGLGNTGNRFLVELENGKPTVQLQKVLAVLELLGLEVVVRPRTGPRL